MRGLLIKDLCLMREMKKMIFIIMIVSVVFVTSGTDSSFLTGYIVILTSLLAGITISYDEMNNGLAFLMTLPITRKQYVMEKYLTGLIMVLVGILYSFIINTGRVIITTGTADLKETILICMIFGTIGIIMLCFSIPIDLKFGAEKGRVMLIFGFMICFCVSFFGFRYLEKSAPEKMEVLIRNITEILSGSGIYLICVLFSMCVLSISFLAACRIIEKKEF